MYPRQELIRFASHKAALRRNIALHRGRCAEAAARAAGPVEFVDRVRTFWRQLSPIVKISAVPVGFILTRAAGPRYRILRELVRWGPLAITVARVVSSAARGGYIPGAAPAQPARSSESAARSQRGIHLPGPVAKAEILGELDAPPVVVGYYPIANRGWPVFNPFRRKPKSMPASAVAQLCALGVHSTSRSEINDPSISNRRPRCR